ncbi:MAG: hypothetical protein HY722_08160 [Planctomycetes bacterium]|nr:hypothetical protein [Planctomycetota bacterium]
MALASLLVVAPPMAAQEDTPAPAPAPEMVPTPAPTPAEGPKEDVSFLRDLPFRKVATLEDALRGMMLLVEGHDRPMSFEERIAWCLRRKAGQRLLSADWELEASTPVTRGMLAYMMGQTLEVKGGVMLRLLRLMQRSYERYYLRELQYTGVIREGPRGEVVDGVELIATLDRAERWRRGEEIQ